MEGQEMIKLYSDFPVVRDLMELREDSRLTSAMKDRIQILEQELQLLVLYSFCLEHLYGPSKSRSGGVSRIDNTLGKKGLSKIDSGELQEWDNLSSELLEEIRSYKPSIREDCFHFSDCKLGSFWSVSKLHYKFSDKAVWKFVMYLSDSMTNVLLKGEIWIPDDEKMKFESLKLKLNSFREVSKFTTKVTRPWYQTGYLETLLIDWAWKTACFWLLNWSLDVKEESMAPKLNLILSKLQQNLDDDLPPLARTCLSHLKATKPSVEERVKTGELLWRFGESLLENLKGYLANDHFEMILNGMIFLITFIMDLPPPEANQGELILIQASNAVEDAVSLITSISYDKVNETDIAEARNFLLHVFLEKVNSIKEEVRKTYPRLLLDSSSFNCPRINILTLFDSIIENLKGISFHFPNHPILMIHRELVMLRNLLESLNLKELQIEHKEMKDPWTRVSNLAHHVDRTIKSFTYLKGFLWVDMLCLHDAKEELKSIWNVVERIQGQHMNDISACRTEMNLSPIVPFQTNVQTMDEVVVGFEDKAKYIQDLLTSGSEKLNIISIIGMPGLGKTTLAKKVYNDPSIKRHFTICAWCTVSQSYDTKKLLLDILNDVTVVKDSFYEMDEAELALKLKQCLHGRKYLIVMDDIWDVDAWNELKLSFPDDDKCSRILFTSRIHDVVLSAKPDSIPYCLSPLSNEESWELLEERLFHNKDIFPRDFAQVGKQIATDCEGLPLAVVLVAGLLKKKVENLDWWKQIRDSIVSRISEQGCAHILELSYKHLPEPLKACFLYFGLFPEDKVIAVQKLIKLWVSEGFIQKLETKEVEIVAKEYVMDLVGRSLLMVTNRGSIGGIKSCRIHDLLREFCMAKSEEEHFFKLLNGNDVSQVFKDAKIKHHRVSIEAQHRCSFLVKKSCPIYSLHISPTATSQPIGMDYRSFCNARFLQVLDLEDVKFLGDFPEELTTLVLLRYLAICCTTKHIPPAIVTLKDLETLIVRNENTCVFPSGLLQLENLRHVDIGKFFTHGLFGKARPLKNIQSLSSPCLNYGKETEIFLKTVPTIRKLRCEFYSYPCDSLTKLQFLSHLDSFNATNSRSRVGRFPFSLPSTLKKLTLSHFCLPWTELSRIAELPNLEVLKLLLNAFVGKCWNMEDDDKFLKLKFLKLHYLDIREWNASDENFPSLEQIVVEQCHSLKQIPTTFGYIPTLKVIQVRRSSASVVNSAKKIQEQQIEFGNENFEIVASKIFKDEFFY